MQEDDDNLLLEAEKRLENELSLGNSMLKSIDGAWLEHHKELLDLFIKDPNDPAVLERIPPATDGMEVCQPASSSEVQHSQFVAVVEPLAEDFGGRPTRPLRAPSAPQVRLPVITGYRDNSPSMDTPGMQATASTDCQDNRGARSDPLTAGPRSSGSLNRNVSTLVPEVSLAARAGSLGATSMMTSARANSGGMRRPAALPLRSSDSEAVATGGEEVPERRGPGRKKRTAPILVETEDGETKYVSPTEFRKLRRRITNRLSARRMRKKHAEERAHIKTTTETLEEERNFYRTAYQQQQQQMQELEERYKRLEVQLLSLNKQLRMGNLNHLQPTQQEQQPVFPYPAASAPTSLQMQPSGYLLQYSSVQASDAAAVKMDAAAAMVFADPDPGLGMPDIPASLASPCDDLEPPLPLFRQPPTAAQVLPGVSGPRVFSGRPVLE